MSAAFFMRKPRAVRSRPSRKCNVWRPEAAALLCDCCGCCVAVCDADAIRLGEKGPDIDIGRCTGCGACIAACPVHALSEVGLG